MQKSRQPKPPGQMHPFHDFSEQGKIIEYRNDIDLVYFDLYRLLIDAGW
jgi:hypothetical protein